jgi:nucleoid DNA-binding protein
MDFEGFVSAQEYLLNNKKYAPINTDELSDIVTEIEAHTGLTKEQAQEVLNLYFHEIRNFMLNGKFVTMKKFGRFYIKHCADQRVRINFKPSPSLIRRLNAK